MNLIGRIGSTAQAAGPFHLALALVATLAAFGLNVLANLDVEAALRTQACDGLDCLKSLRPDTRYGGYSADEFRTFLATLGPLRWTALKALAADLPLILAVTATLLIAGGLATRGAAFLNERTRILAVVLPLAYAAADLVEDAALALVYAGLADTSLALPWISALKFGLAAASALISLFLGLTRSSLG